MFRPATTFDAGTVRLVDALDLDACPLGAITRMRVWMVADGLGDRTRVPVVVLRGATPGPVLGVTAVLHGNELNGMPVVHELIRSLDPAAVVGSVVVVPVINVPGYHLHQRQFLDSKDLNQTFPGKEGGTPSQVFAHRFLNRVVRSFTHLVDVHTASFGRVNSLYVRSDMNHPVAADMAISMAPELIVHNFGTDGTLRSAAMAAGIPAITVEVGNPQRFQPQRISDTCEGLRNLMTHLGMTDAARTPPPSDPVICARSYWLYTETGGVLSVYPALLDRLAEGQPIADVRDVFDREIDRCHAPQDGVVVGHSTNPVGPTGSRILHLGVVGDPATVTDPSPRNE